jgi:hypothetical protein
MPVRELSDGNPDGTRLGNASSDLLGFYGLTTPIVRPSVTAYTTTTAATSTSPWGFGTSTQADAVNTAVRQMATALRSLGLVG